MGDAIFRARLYRPFRNYLIERRLFRCKSNKNYEVGKNLSVEMINTDTYMLNFNLEIHYEKEIFWNYFSCYCWCCRKL